MAKIRAKNGGQNPADSVALRRGKETRRDEETRLEETGNPHYGTKLSNRRPMKFGGCAGLLRLRFHFQALVAPEENSIRILFDL